VSGVELDIVESAQDSANVVECSTLNNDVDNNIEYSHENVPSSPQTSYDSRRTGCSSNPCRNNGLCYPLSPTDYKCSCLTGYRCFNLCNHLSTLNTLFLAVKIVKLKRTCANSEHLVKMEALAGVTPPTTRAAALSA
jgi:hypothetical protein